MCTIIGSDGDWGGRRTGYRAHRLVMARVWGESTKRSTGRGCLSLHKTMPHVSYCFSRPRHLPCLAQFAPFNEWLQVHVQGPLFPEQSTWLVGNPPSGRAHGHAPCPELPSPGCHDKVESLVTGKSFMAPAS